MINADYYNKKTSDLLFSVPLPQYSGYPDQLKNIGEVVNNGFEFALEVINIVEIIHWNSKFNLSLNRNKVTSLPDGNDVLYRTAPGQLVGIQNSQIIREGEPLGAFYGFVYEGVQQSGILDLKLADIVKDEELLLQAREACYQILKQDSKLELPEHSTLKKYLDQRNKSSNWSRIS